MEGQRGQERERETDRQMKNNKSVDLTYTSDDDVKPTWHKTGVISDKKTRNNRNAVYSSKYEDEDSHTHIWNSKNSPLLFVITTLDQKQNTHSKDNGN